MTKHEHTNTKSGRKGKAPAKHSGVIDLGEGGAVVIDGRGRVVGRGRSAATAERQARAGR